MKNEIIFQTITSTPTGVGATEGRNMAKAFNNNFKQVKTLLDTLFQAVSIQVSSENITQIKVDTSTTPYSVYYTTDPLNVPEPNWILFSTTFANLSGQPTDNIALKTILDSKAPNSTVDGLSTTVAQHTTSLNGLTTDMTEAKQNIGTLQSQVASLGSEFNSVVRTDVGSTMYVRYNALLNVVEYSTTGQENDWHSIIATNIQFADLTGLPEDNPNLVQYIQSQLSTTITGFVTPEQLIAHTTDTNNPHEVTAEQLGLGNVLTDIASLKGSANLANNVILSDFLEDNEQSDEAIYYISSQFVDPETYGTFTTVRTLTSEDDKYTTVDGDEITFETDFSTLPQWYRCIWNEDVTQLTIKYNEELRTYMKGGAN